MAYDYKQHFGEITLTQDLTTLPDERTWRLQAPERDAEPHQIVLYLGCNVLRTSHMIRTVTAIFDRLGLDYVAVGGPTYCCGIVHHRNGDTAASGGMNKRTVELFKRYKPEEVVMWCPSCMYFYDEVQKFPWPFPVRHTTEFLDRYKTFRLWQDPERVLAESTPCQTANHVEPTRARDLVEKTFGRIAIAPSAGAAAS